VVRYWHAYLSGARCKWFAYGAADATATSSSLVPVKSRMVYLSSAGLPRLSSKGPLNGCSSSSYYGKLMGSYCSKLKILLPVKLPPIPGLYCSCFWLFFVPLQVLTADCSDHKLLITLAATAQLLPEAADHLYHRRGRQFHILSLLATVWPRINLTKTFKWRGMLHSPSMIAEPLVCLHSV